MPDIRISVIIPCYNYGHYVAETIESVLAQTRPADEIVVIDDGSSDNSLEVAQGYADRVTVVPQANAGHIAARNNGVNHATGDVIIFLDADDTLLPDALAQVAQHWAPDVAKVQYDLELIDGAGESLGRLQCGFDREYSPGEIAAEFARTGTYRWPVMSGNAYARGLIDRFLGVPPPQAQDGLLNTLAPLYGRIITIPRPLGQYRHHTNSVSRQGGGSDGGKFPDFPVRIQRRRAEFQLLRDYAAETKTPLPQGDLIDNELTFVGYKAMAKALRMPYEQDDRESRVSILAHIYAMLLRGQYKTKTRILQALWYSALTVSPPDIARKMIRKRFNRGRNSLI